MGGKRVEYQSVPYTSIKAFSVKSAGNWDRDAEVEVYIHSPWMPVVSMDLKKGQADVIAIQNFLAAQVIGGDENRSGLSEQGAHAAGIAALQAGKNAGSLENFLNWIGDDARQIDSATVDQTLHVDPPILRQDEKVDLAFKSGRDMFVFTTKRLLKVDVQGWSGKKVEYLTIPLKNCSAFAV